MAPECVRVSEHAERASRLGGVGPSMDQDEGGRAAASGQVADGAASAGDQHAVDNQRRSAHGR